MAFRVGAALQHLRPSEASLFRPPRASLPSSTFPFPAFLAVAVGPAPAQAASPVAGAPSHPSRHHVHLR